MQHEVTFVSGPDWMFEFSDILKSEDDETKEVKPWYAKHSNLNGQHRGYTRICWNPNDENTDPAPRLNFSPPSKLVIQSAEAQARAEAEHLHDLVESFS